MKYNFHIIISILISCLPQVLYAQTFEEIKNDIFDIETPNCQYTLLGFHINEGNFDYFTTENEELKVVGDYLFFKIKIKHKRNKNFENDRADYNNQLDAIFEEYGFENIYNSIDSTQRTFTFYSAKKIIFAKATIPHSKKNSIDFSFVTQELRKNIIEDPSFESEFESTFYHHPMWINGTRFMFPHRMPPTAHMVNTNRFGNSYPPADGNQYVSLVTREDGSYQMLSQTLGWQLSQDSCYQFTIDIRHEKEFRSKVYNDQKEKYFTSPVQLRVSLSNYLDRPEEIIYQSGEALNDQWEQHLIEFQPTDIYKFILFEVNSLLPTISNGNIFIDNINNFKVKICTN